MYGGDEVNAVVLDVGASAVKAGYAGEDNPKAVFPSSCGVVNRTENGGASEPSPMEGVTGNQQHWTASNRKIFAGSQAVGFPRPHMEIVSAIQNGAYSDWELIEAIWQHAFSDQLRLNTKEHPIMLAEPTFQARQTREKVVELMFEKFSPPALFLAKNAVLSSFATGRQTSMVIDMGYESSVISAVHDGYVLQKSIVRSPLGGKLLSDCMLHSVHNKGITIRPSYAFTRTENAMGLFEAKPLDLPNATESFRRFHVEQIANDIKESICRVSDTAFDAEANANIPTVDYELPDGALVQVGPDRFNVPEVLFQPSVLKAFSGVKATPADGGQVDSIPASVVKSIELCDVDVRKDLYSGIIATGGTSQFAQLRERLDRELAESAPQAAKVKVVSPANNLERRFSVWIGGSILASLGSFQQMWMSKSEYEEHGASLIHRRAP